MVKRFHHYEHRTSSLREFFIRTVLRRPIHVRRAHFTLRELDLEVSRGESVALIGHNGSGKSSVLRLIAGIYEPSEGTIRVEGRLAAVIELGVGFHPELTGAENIALYASVMGLTRSEIRQRFSAIVEFAEVGEFINEPVKYYSSGMQARLAFAVAARVEPDILLIDEALAVGDQGFREKCMSFLHEFHGRGGTLLIVSHDLDSLSELCRRAIWLDHGRVRASGDATEIIEAYRAQA